MFVSSVKPSVFASSAARGISSGRKWSLITGVLVTALLAGLLNVIATTTASAALGDKTLYTWNMQGESASDNKWTLGVGRFFQNGASPIVALQEAGPAEPPHARGTDVEFLGAADRAQLPAGVQGELPPRNNAGGPQEVRHSQWSYRGRFLDVYFLQTDPNGDRWARGRVNLAIVAERAADEVVIVPNPHAQITDYAARAVLGTRFGDTWYFSVHALSSNHGGDARVIVQNLDRFVGGRNRGEHWVAMGDWNRSPESMAGQLPPGAGIFRSGEATQNSGGELDWMIYSDGAAGGVHVGRLPGFLSDHDAVQLGPLRAASEPEDLFGDFRTVENMQAGGVVDVYQGQTANGTAVNSGRRNGGLNQSFKIDFTSSDGAVRFRSEQGSCVTMPTATGGPTTIQGCDTALNQNFYPEFMGNDEFQFRLTTQTNNCLNVSGGQTDPNNSRPMTLWPCQNTANERFILNAAHVSSAGTEAPVDLAQQVAPEGAIENLKAGGVMDLAGGIVANNTKLTQYHRGADTNQGWDFDWLENGSVVIRSHNDTAFCVDGGMEQFAGFHVVLNDCSPGQRGQLWRPEQMSNGTVELISIDNPNYCLGVEGGPVDPNDGELILWNCMDIPDQEWMFTPYDPTGRPTKPAEWKDFAVLPGGGKPADRTAYYPSWSIYANDLKVKDLDTRGIAGKLTTLVYAFENIDPTNLTCFANNKSGSSDENSATGNDGASDAWADYQKGFTAAESVNGTGDSWGQPLAGNFNQLKQLKAKHPDLKIVISIGGWTYSKYFSDVASTDAARKKFVSSCIDLYIKGNLPQLDDNPSGGTGVAAGIFDGFDIDWEFPASDNGHLGNHQSPADTANYTLLLAEFRHQLDALGGSHRQLSAALPSGAGDIAKLEVGNLSTYLDRANVMTYDMHGAWETTGPTNFQAPLWDAYTSPANGSKLTAEDAILGYLNQGFPAAKLTMGVPFYGRGWQGVPDNGVAGLYQSVTGATDPFPFSQQPGVAFYKELKDAGKLNDVHIDEASGGSWVYDGSNFWSIETPETLAMKRQYIADLGLGGIMMYSLEADDSSSTLLNAATGFTS